MRQHLQRFVVGSLTALLTVSVLQVDPVAAQAGQRGRVLVARFATAQGVDDDFGEKIAKRVRKRVRNFDILTSIDKDEIEDALDRLDTDWEEMDYVSWRQLASQLNAQLLVWGEAARSTGNNGGPKVESRFLAVKSGDETKLPEVTVRDDDDDGAERAAEHIARRLNQHVEFLRAVLNCQDYLSASQFDDAVRNCDAALEIQPKSTQALYLRGQVAQEQEKWPEARKYYAAVLEQSSSHQDALQALAYVNAQLGNMDRSTELYRRYLEFNPDDQDVRLSVAYNLASAGGYGAAMELIQDGLERDSTSSALWKYLGDVAMRRGLQGSEKQVKRSSAIADSAAMEAAVQAYEKYAALADSVEASLYRNMIKARLQLGQTEKAASTAREALEKVKEDPALWSLLADVRARQNDLSGAVAAMDSVLAMDSDYPNAHFKRGVLSLRAGDEEAALENFRAAVEEEGQDPNAIANAVFSKGYNNHFKAGNYEKALEMFNTALEFARKGETQNRVHFFTGYAHYKLGQAIDERNKEDSQCRPARRALEHFQQVMPHIEQAGDYQAGSHESIRQGTDVFLYRQEQIIKKTCKSG